MPDAAPYYSSIRTTFAADYEVGPENALSKLGRVNFFVGQNNCGKSRFLRALLQAKNFEYKPSKPVEPATVKALKELGDLVEQKLNQLGIIGYGPITDANTIRQLKLDEWYRNDTNPLAEVKKLIDALVKTQAFNPTFAGNRIPPPAENVRLVHEREILPIAKRLLSSVVHLEPLIEEPRWYVPSLRGLRPVSKDPGDVYSNRTMSDYKLTTSLVFTGYGLYGDVRDLLLGDRSERDRVREFEDFMSTEIFEQSVELIPHRSSDVLRIRIGDEPERPLYDLGDGIQSILTLTFRAVTADKRSLFFFEEPETHLHPGLQRRLIELFITHPLLKKHQVFATTHSNHFLDLGADYDECATLLFRQRPLGTTPRFEIRTLGHDDRMILHELGVRASSVFLTNAAIWVEGITDRLYIREFLTRYVRDVVFQDAAARVFREDVHYSLIEIGGANAAHFSFDPTADDFDDRVRVSKICSESLLILDGDNAGKPRAVKLQQELGDRIVILSSKEIEHLLPVEVIRAYVRHRAPSIDSERLTAGTYQGLQVPLGKALDELFGTTTFTDGQTIKNKMGFCTFCVEWMRSNEWILTKEAAELCGKVWRFISGANSKEPREA